MESRISSRLATRCTRSDRMRTDGPALSRSQSDTGTGMTKVSHRTANRCTQEAIRSAPGDNLFQSSADLFLSANMTVILVIVRSTREGRFSEKPAKWILHHLKKHQDTH